MLLVLLLTMQVTMLARSVATCTMWICSNNDHGRRDDEVMMMMHEDRGFQSLMMIIMMLGMLTVLTKMRIIRTPHINSVHRQHPLLLLPMTTLVVSVP